MKIKLTLTAIALLGASLAMAQSNTLKAGEALGKGKSLTSQNGTFMVEKDPREGGFNIYTKKGSMKVMVRGLTGSYVYPQQLANDAAKLILQADGNLVVYDDKKKATWDSKTQGFFDAKYGTADFKPVKGVLENDGTFVLYSATGKAVWKR